MRVIWLLSLLILISCDSNECSSQGIEIPAQLLDVYPGYCHMVNELLEENESIESFIQFNCAGGAFCYDHGFVLVQLIDHIGDEEAAKKWFEGLPADLRKSTISLIEVGLLYGRNTEENIEEVFPMAYSILIRE